MSPVENYHNYRDACRKVDMQTPILPSISMDHAILNMCHIIIIILCLAIYLADVAAIEVPERVPGDINMAYVKQVSELLRAFRSCQKNHHKLRYCILNVKWNFLMLKYSKTLPWIYGDPILKEEELESLSNMYAEKESPQVR